MPIFWSERNTQKNNPPPRMWSGHLAESGIFALFFLFAATIPDARPKAEKKYQQNKPKNTDESIDQRGGHCLLRFSQGAFGSVKDFFVCRKWISPILPTPWGMISIFS